MNAQLIFPATERGKIQLSVHNNKSRVTTSMYVTLVVTKNLSNHLQLIARKDNVAQIHQMTAIENIPSLSEEEITIRPKAKE